MNTLYHKVCCTLLILGCCMHATFAQDAEFRWEKHFHGSSVQYSNPDQLFETLFDSAGNVYVFGKAGWGAQIDGEDIGPEGMSGICLFVAKFDTLGTKVWLKSAAQNGHGCGFSPSNMYLRNDKIIVGFQIFPSYTNRFDSIVLFDTTFYVPNPYRYGFPFQVLTFFVSFDLDGNMLDYHFLKLSANQDELRDTPITEFSRSYYVQPLSDTRFIFDSQGNICLFSSCPNVYWDSIDHPYFTIDDDSTTCYPLDFSPYSDRLHQISASFFLKIDTNWHIVKQKFLVDSAENWPEMQYPSGNTVRSRLCSLVPHNLSIDKEGNIYYVGSFEHLGHNDKTADIIYPYYIYLDSLHYFKLEDFWPGHLMPVVIKFTPNGDVLWCNQLYSNHGLNFTYPCFPGSGYCDADDTKVYVSLSANDTVFFDENHTLKMNFHDGLTSFLVIYDKLTGDYLGHVQYDTLSENSMDTDVEITKGLLVTTSASYDTYWYLHGVEYATNWLVKIDLNTLEMTKTSPIYALTGGEFCIHPQGYLFRTAHDDHIHGNDFDMNNTTKEMALLFFYDSTLDERRERACPATLSFEASLQQGNSVLCSWDAEDTSATWELAYTSDSTNWASATMLFVNGSDTTIWLDASGCYHFRVRRVCDWGKRGAWSATTTVCATEGIDSPGRQSLFSLSPNPASTQVQVVCDEEVQGIMVFNMAGVCVMNQTSKWIDISTLPKGIYQVRVLTPSGSSSQKLVVK